MKLYIPEISDRIKLEEEWTFKPVKESRNEGLFNFFLPKEIIDNMVVHVYNWNYNTKTKIDENFERDFEIKYGEIENFKNKELVKKVNRYFNFFSEKNKHLIGDFNVTIPKDSILKVDRIYIRKGASDFSSVTFYLESIPGVKMKNKIRFFANLTDVNDIEVSVNRMNFLKIGKKDSLKNLINYCEYFKGTKRNFYRYSNNEQSELLKFRPKDVNVSFEKKDILTIRAVGDGLTEFVCEEYKWNKLNAMHDTEKITDWKMQIVESNEIIFESKKEEEIINFIENFVYQVYIKN